MLKSFWISQYEYNHKGNTLRKTHHAYILGAVRRNGTSGDHNTHRNYGHACQFVNGLSAIPFLMKVALKGNEGKP